ncbi:Eukaryotic aspartyl protease family protein [Striga hermonthica]|uniref:Eukaryotic aspartyl protease family protein n=1 Tax=Striga hermonthica TaxID=68872 RepID=A0A9N7RC52_STRHE|nr:Eukaryotic aspartyl protease family protein [Striga hermonthica]
MQTRMDTRFERMEHRLEMMEKSLDEVCTKFSTIETMLAAIMKEKEKSSDSRTFHETDTSQTTNHTTTLSGTPKIDLPSFDGSNPPAWIARAEQFFLVHHTPVAEKVPIALVAMSGDALYWVQGLMRRFPTIAWPQFIEELLFRFSTLTTVNAYEALKVTRQTGSVDEYITEFEAYVAQVTDLSDPHYLGQFLGGLREDIRIRIRDDPSMNVYAAIRLARQVERELNFTNFPSGKGQPRSSYSPFSSSSRPLQAPRFSSPLQHSSQIQHPQARSTPTLSSGASQKGSTSNTGSTITSQKFFRVRQLTLSEYQSHQKQGLCYRCSQPYGPTHVCPARSLNVMLAGEEMDVSQPSESEIPIVSEMVEEVPDPLTTEPPLLQTLQLSHLAAKGFDGPHTMKLISRLENLKLLTMVDSGASHCFISERVVDKLGLHVEPSPTYSVMLGNGQRISSQGLCRAVSLYLQTATFMVDCFVFPLGGVDIILGVSWLASLGDVKANWKNLTMEIVKDGRTILLRGDPSFTRQAVSVATVIREFSDGEQTWLLWSMDHSESPPHCPVSIEPHSPTRDALSPLLAEFSEILTPFSGLPPKRHIDHRINLQPEDLRDRDEVLRHLRFHLERAQQRMIREANKHLRDVEFAVGDKVFVKFRPFRQRTLFRSMNTKLAPRFFGPFEVEARIGAVFYRLKLPGTARVHPVFHVSLLKASMGVNSIEPTFPDELLGDDPLFIPEKVLAR